MKIAQLIQCYASHISYDLINEKSEIEIWILFYFQICTDTSYTTY